MSADVMLFCCRNLAEFFAPETKVDVRQRSGCVSRGNGTSRERCRFELGPSRPSVLVIV